MTRLHSYVVVRDYGFAPNPFHGWCTLATCKPRIRRVAVIGDWVVGTGSKKQQRDGYLVFAMRVTEAMSFSDYWNDPRFHKKRPNLHGSIVRAFGDNIYEWDNLRGSWLQANSHHSLNDGTLNMHNVRRDTSVDRVLISDDFVYFGGQGPRIPSFGGDNIVHMGIGHRNGFSQETIAQFHEWLGSLEMVGYCGIPLDWR